MTRRRALSSPCRPLSIVLDIVGWSIPLLVSAPSLFIWAGLMTMPLVVYLIIMFVSIFNPAITYAGQEHSVQYFVSALDVLLLGGPYWPDKLISILGIFLMVYSTIHLNRERKKGLATSGPYRFIRNSRSLRLHAFLRWALC